MIRKRLPFIIFLLAALLLANPVYAVFSVEVGAAILIDPETGQVLYEKNADVPMAPASIVKLMTLLLVFEAIDEGKANWDDKVTISEKAWATVQGTPSKSKMFLEIGQKVSIEDLVYGISIASANDACVAVAEHLYGSEDAFVRAMNRRAEELGLKESSFRNSNGLPAPGQQMSARDISTMSAYLINTFPKILEIESQREFTYNNIPQQNYNKLPLSYEGADGLKTGYTSEAGYCLVGTAQRGDRRLISVVLQTESNPNRLTASRELLDHGFNNFKVESIADPGEILGEVDVENARKRMLPLTVSHTLKIALPRGRKAEELTKKVASGEPIEAPLEAGDIAATLQIMLDDEVISSVPLVAAEDSRKAGFLLSIWRKAASFISSLLPWNN